MKRGRKPQPIEERFWKHVVRATADACWPWTGAIGDKGYGLMGISGHNVGVHRIAWILEYGPIPSGQKVDHRCDRRHCCNPAHLLLRTHAEYMRDVHAKKGEAARIALGDVLEPSNVMKSLGLSKSTLLRLTRSGRLRTVHSGRRVFFRPQDVKECLESCRTSPRVKVGKLLE